MEAGRKEVTASRGRWTTRAIGPDPDAVDTLVSRATTSDSGPATHASSAILSANSLAAVATAVSSSALPGAPQPARSLLAVKTPRFSRAEMHSSRSSLLAAASARSGCSSGSSLGFDRLVW